MHIRTRLLYPKARRHVPVKILLTTILIAVAMPIGVRGTDENAPFEQEFVITAYYSPLPGQCCYVKGGYTADKILNGEGVRAADGTSVYPGMVAAPGVYAFGTRITLPSLGTFTVHDRGGAILDLGNGVHRLDIWAGYGEEGLARALAFGVKRIRGTVYPNGSNQPPNAFALTNLPLITERLEPFLVEGNLLNLQPKLGDRGKSVEMLQQTLKTLGYFDRSVTDLYGEETQAALKNFMDDFGVAEPADRLTETTASLLIAANRRLSSQGPIREYIDPGDEGTHVQAAKRTLRFLQYFEGRTGAEYDAALEEAIFSFQKDHLLVGTREDIGAGRIGPKTIKMIEDEWNRKLVKNMAQRYRTIAAIDRALVKRGENLDRFLSEGDAGEQVELLQRLLAKHGFFPEEKINGNFGPQTKEAVLRYQLDRKLISASGDEGAGTIGPVTLKSLRSEERRSLYLLVRGQGWGAL